MCRISRISAADRTKLAAMKSNPCRIPNRISSRSRWFIYGMDRDTPGTLTPFLSFITPSFSTRQQMSLPLTSCTVRRMRPSSSRMVSPVFTSCASAG